MLFPFQEILIQRLNGRILVRGLDIAVHVHFVNAVHPALLGSGACGSGLAAAHDAAPLACHDFDKIIFRFSRFDAV